jgi:hypothetical protein
MVSDGSAGLCFHNDAIENEIDCHDYSPIKQYPQKPRFQRTFRNWVEVKKLSLDLVQLRELSITSVIPKCIMELRHEDKTSIRYKKTQDLKEKFVQQFYCAAKTRFGCPFEAKLETFVDDGYSVLSQTEDHVHDYSADKEQHHEVPRGIAIHVQEFIKTVLMSNGKIRPKDIMRKIRDAKILPKPEMSQIKNFLARVRNELFSSLKTDDYGSLVRWIADNQFHEHLAEDEMFVLPGAVYPESLEWDDVSRIRLVFVLSTKALLRNIIHQQDSTMPNLQVCDGTFNLLANGSPTLVLGTLDWDHKFRLEGIGYTSHHDEEAFTALYKSAAAGTALIAAGRTLKGDYTMQDGAREIFNASTKVLAPKVIGSCLFHAAQAIENKKAEFSSKQSFNDFKKDFKILQAVSSSTIFHHAATLFIGKWDCKEPAISAWYDDNYLKWRQTFYPAATPPGIPATNNANENFNGCLKLEGTQRTLMSTGQFLHAMGNNLRHLSHGDEMGAPFPLHPTLSLHDWRVAQEWLKAVGIAAVFANRDKSAFMVPSSLFLGTKPTLQDMRAQLARWKQKDTPIEGENFHAYTFRMGSFYRLKILRGQAVLCAELILSCTCPFYAKKHKCKHCLGVGIAMKLFPVPIDMSLERIGVRNPDGTLKRGRKRLAPTSTNTRRKQKNNAMPLLQI